MIKYYVILLSAVILVLLYSMWRARKIETNLRISMEWLFFVAVITAFSNMAFVVARTEFFSSLGFSVFSAMIDWLLLLLADFIQIYTDTKESSHKLKIFMIIFAASDSVCLLMNVFWNHVFSVENVEYLGKYDIYIAGDFTGLYYIHLLFCYVISVWIISLLVYRMFKSPHFYRKKYTGVLVMFLALIIIDMICVIKHIPFNASIVLYIGLSVALYYYGLIYIPSDLVVKMQSLMLEQIDSAIICYDERGKCIYSNNKLGDMLGEELDLDAAEMRYAEYARDRDKNDINRQSWNREREVNGEKRYFYVVSQNIFDTRHNYLGCCFSIIDRSEEQKFHEKEIKLINDANEAKSVFLSRVSHEIRTPVNSIFGMNEMIMRESKDTEIRQYALQVKHATETLLNMINDVLDFSKIESGKMEIVCLNYNPVVMFQNIVEMISVNAQSKGLVFKSDVSSNIPCLVYGDNVRIQQIIMNLLSNAVKYTKEGTVSFKVNCRFENEDVFLKIEVTDTGIGIKEKDIARILKPYERVEDDSNHTTQGTGLGLDITVSLLKLMGSMLNIQSEYGKGSTFSCEIRQRVIDKTPVNLSTCKLTTDNIEYKPQFVAPDAHILIVDDNRMNRFVFRKLLKQTKVQVTEAASGYEFLKLIKENYYDLIFMDHMMPQMDGVESFQQMKKIPNKCDGVPVIMLTANTVAGMDEYYSNIGFANFLSKPIVAEDLENMIKNYLT